MLRMIPVASAATLMAVAAAAAPRSIADCEAIQAADAYNHCLASFGPVAAGHSHGKALPYTASAVEDGRGRMDNSGRVAVSETRRGRARIVLTPRRRETD